MQTMRFNRGSIIPIADRCRELDAGQLALRQKAKVWLYLIACS